jgi:SNF2 family DNA or RNA helicase
MEVKKYLDFEWFEDKKSQFNCSDFLFSKETYQLSIWDGLLDKDFTVFIQFENEETLSDVFCSCEQEGEVCDHIIFSLNKVFNSRSEPLHVRFENSFYNRLFELLAFSYGVFPHVSRKESIFFMEDRDHYNFLRLHSKSDNEIDALNELLIDREQENENNSLKFSKLSAEEFALYREGRPSKEMAYELSIWSDLAKFFFSKKEEGRTFKLHFEESLSALPNALILSYGSLELKVDLSEEILSEILPYLEGVDSNLKVFSGKQAPLDYIEYDPDEISLKLFYKEMGEKQELVISSEDSEGIKFGRWSYFPNKGFVDVFDVKQELEKEVTLGDIGEFLDENTGLLKKELKKYVFKRQESRAQFSIQFTDDWDLSIQAFLFEEGDLEKPQSKIFENWVFIEEKGFFRVRNIKKETVGLIKSDQVGEFIEKNRLWLSQFEGFSFHISSFETSLDYSFNKTKGLEFHFFYLEEEKDIKLAKDFGKWIYFHEQGFFSKQSKSNLHFLSGRKVPIDQLSDFILKEKDLLSELPNFFLEENPLSKIGLKIDIEGDYLNVQPYSNTFSKWDACSISILGKLVYVEGGGFFILPEKDCIEKDFLNGKKIHKKDWDYFFAYEFNKIKSQVSHLSKELLKADDLSLQLEYFKRIEGEGGKSLEIGMNVVSSLGSVSMSEVLEAMEQKRVFLPSKAGLIDLREPALKSLLNLNKTEGSGSKEPIFSLSYFDFFKLLAQSKMELSPSIGLEDERSFKGIFEFVEESSFDLKHLKGELRPYQKHGVEWLWFLYQNQLAGLLCDDMGLGKTHQIMALFAAVLKENSKSKFLVVCPTSVLYHWRDKLEKYLPKASLCFYHGSGRKVKGLEKNKNIVLTSYGICRQEKEAFSKLSFDVAAYDEIQVAKNHNSRIYRSLIELPARFKIGLTGTPIENCLRELKSLFDLVLPKYLPGETEFKRQFSDPIERFHDEKQRKQLHRLVSPFILRRKKEEVLSDLPSKVEEKLICELSKDQMTLYNKQVNAYKEGLISDLKDKTKNVSYIHVFSLLTKLKQICDHPSVFLGETEDYKRYQSGKFEAFLDILQQARSSGQKVVVFSQYLGMLDIIQKYLKENKIGFAGIRGSTSNRGKQIEMFNSKKDCWVFLASLQAAGLGIDLTAASCVIHYDRWWNPSKENQATDRVHRIGQTKGVQVFKMVTKGTLEERIDKLIERKKSLVDGLIQSSEESILKSLSRDELLELLETSRDDY